ncbi:MAG: MerR family transcriptional regulator [Pirellulales bacterium]
MSNDSGDQATAALAGLRVAFVGKLAGMPRRKAQQLVRRHGGVAVEKPDASVNLIVIGEEEFPLAELGAGSLLDDATRRAADDGTIEVVTETQLWQRLGFVESEQHIRRLYTPAMLADLVGVPVAVIRRWHRRGLIVPAREVRRLPYFDFQEVATARRLAELLAAGMSPQAIEKKLAALAKFWPGVERPLAQLSVIVQGEELLLRQGEGLVEPGGQLRFDFEAARPQLAIVPPPATEGQPALQATPSEMLQAAAELEDEGQLEAAAEMYRAAMASAGPNPEVCFLLAELLYRLGDLAGARERYYMAVELDEDYVEARANLGCILAETHQRELAVAAFEGALAYHGDYPDVHYHLARTLDELGRAAEAEIHWRAFVERAGDSPWSDEARQRLERKADAGK